MCVLLASRLLVGQRPYVLRSVRGAYNIFFLFRFHLFIACLQAAIRRVAVRTAQQKRMHVAARVCAHARRALGRAEGSVGGGNGVGDGTRRMGVGERGGGGGDGERLIELKAKIGDVSQELRLLKAAVQSIPKTLYSKNKIVKLGMLHRKCGSSKLRQHILKGRLLHSNFV